MSAEVTRRVELGVDDRADAGVEVAGRDHLVVAGARREVLARLADPGEAGDLVRVGVAVRAVDLAVGERGVLGPVAAVDVADDDVLAGAAADAALVDAAELVPEPVRLVEPEERRRRRGVELEVLGLLDHEHAVGQLELGRLGLGQLGREAVEDGRVVVDLGAADLVDSTIVRRIQVPGVLLGGVGGSVELLPLRRLRRGIARHAAVVPGERCLDELDDVGGCLARVVATGSRYDEQDGHQGQARAEREQPSQTHICLSPECVLTRPPRPLGSTALPKPTDRTLPRSKSQGLLHQTPERPEPGMCPAPARRGLCRR